MSNEETAAAAAPPPAKKLRVAKRKNSKPRIVPIRLGHGVWVHARPLDAFEHSLTLAEARADLNAIMSGAPPLYAWTFTAERIEQLRASEDLRQVVLGWMRNVLTATKSVQEFSDGAGNPPPLEFVTYAEDGETELATEAPPPCFATFELLFHDATIEMRFRVAAFEVESMWSAEKNVSAPAPDGRGRADLNTAQAAATPATAAPGEASESFPMVTADPAQSPPTHPTPPSDQSPGKSEPPAAPGAAPA